jgi:hypothetical protein
VVITANDPGVAAGQGRLEDAEAGTLEPGQSFEVPASAQAPVLTTGKPEGLRISVGTADAPPSAPRDHGSQRQPARARSDAPVHHSRALGASDPARAGLKDSSPRKLGTGRLRP